MRFWWCIQQFNKQKFVEQFTAAKASRIRKDFVLWVRFRITKCHCEERSDVAICIHKASVLHQIPIYSEHLENRLPRRHKCLLAMTWLFGSLCVYRQYGSWWCIQQFDKQKFVEQFTAAKAACIRTDFVLWVRFHITQCHCEERSDVAICILKASVLHQIPIYSEHLENRLPRRA